MNRKVLLLLLAFFYAAGSGAFASDAQAITNVYTGSGLVEKGGFIWGINGHPLGGEGVYTEDRGISLNQQIGLLKELGLTWYRCDVFAVEPKDELDVIVPPAEKAGINLYVVLHPPIELRPYHTLPGRFDSNDVIYKKCFDHAYAAAKKWKGRIKVWDLMNEPEGETWSILPGSNPEVMSRHGDELGDYNAMRIDIAAAILKGQADGIRAGDPDARISLNTGGWFHYGFVDHMIRKGVDFDILSWHWYNEMGDIDGIKHIGNVNLLEELKKFKKPIWLGEYNYRPQKGKKAGYDSTDNAWLLKTIQRLYSYRNDGVEAVFIYELLDLPSDNPMYGNYGLVGIERKTGSDGKEVFAITERKPIFYEIQSWLASLKALEFHRNK